MKRVYYSETYRNPVYVGYDSHDPMVRSNMVASSSGLHCCDVVKLLIAGAAILRVCVAEWAHLCHADTGCSSLSLSSVSIHLLPCYPTNQDKDTDNPRENRKRTTCVLATWRWITGPGM